MWFKTLLRSIFGILLAKSPRYKLVNQVPCLKDRLRGTDEFGLYLHIPFCRQICPYCPYNKVLYDVELAQAYADAVMREIDCYSKLAEGKTVTSFYIGGGTPTTMLNSGLERILSHIHRSFHMECDIHMESHPNDLSEHALDKIEALGIQHLSIGVEALQDHHLKTLHRPYTAEEVQGAVGRAVARAFTCVNADFIFALPQQTYEEVTQAGSLLVEMGVDQIAAYPLFNFPYTRWKEIVRERRYRGAGLLKRRKMLAILERIFTEAGYQRTSVWAFTKRGVPKYCSVTVPLYWPGCERRFLSQGCALFQYI